MTTIADSDATASDEYGRGHDVDSDEPADSGAISVHSRGSRRSTVITLTTVMALVVAVGLTLLGLGTTNDAVTNFDASSWLFSSSRGEVDRVNAVTARVDTRTKLKDAQNHEIQITQTDKYLILRDLDTGQVSALDLTTLQVSAVMATTPGFGVSVALYGETAFVIDSVQGQVRQLDPRNLAPVGEAITLPNGIAPGGFDGKGTLWIAVPTEGTVVAIAPGSLTPSGPPPNPSVVRTVTVAPPGHDLVLSALDDGVAVLDNTDQVLKTVKTEVVGSTAVPIDQPAAMPTRTSGGSVPVTVKDNRNVIVVTGSTVVTFTVPGAGPLSPAVFFAGRVYCADSTAGVVYEFDAKGTLLSQIKIPGAGGPLELEVREDHLFINAPDGATARVVDENHVVKEVNKYQDGVPGADPPAPPKQEEKPKPTKAVPGKPTNVSAAAGNAQVRVTWRKARDNGAPITKYVVIGGGQTLTVGANQRSVVVTNLTNGKPYKFTVHAVNSVGAGPKASTPTVVPTSDVPAAPTSVTAAANPDGTVTVKWPAANGLGRKIVRYTVTSISNGAQAPVGDVAKPAMTIAAGSLNYGDQYAFTVVAVNDKGAGSDPSPVSNTVVPYTKPGKPGNVSAAAVTNQKGAVRITWQAAPSNGRPIDKYVVDVNGKTTDVTGTSVTLSGFGDDQAVTATVHAVNVAGAGPDVTVAARTIGVPSLTLTSSTSAYRSVSVTFTPNNKGGDTVCKLQITGAGSAQRACTTAPMTLTVTGLWPNNTYSFTVSITSAAGGASATGTRATPTLRATVLCGDTTYCGSGIYVYSVATQTNPSNAVGKLYAGNQFTPACRNPNADDVNAQPWGGHHSNQWLRLTYKGATAWFPFAWVNTDGGNDLSLIPVC